MPEIIKVHKIDISAVNSSNIENIINMEIKRNKIKNDQIINIQIEHTQFLFTVYIFYKSFVLEK